MMCLFKPEGPGNNKYKQTLLYSMCPKWGKCYTMYTYCIFVYWTWDKRGLDIEICHLLKEVCDCDDYFMSQLTGLKGSKHLVTHCGCVCEDVSRCD